MRTFEIILIVMNLAAIYCGFKRVSKTTWIGIAAASLLALILHGALESFRWQMTLSYAFAVLAIIYALAKTSGKFSRIRIPKALKITGLSAISLLIILTAFVSYALPVFKLPKPTGGYAVGVKYFDLTDQNRTDPFLASSTQKRQLRIKVYYPGKADNTKPFMPYFDGSTQLMQSFAGFYMLPKFAFSHFGLVTTHSKVNLAPSNKQTNYPVVLFSNGAGTTMEVETTQSEDLASHGYIVIDIDHPYVSAATVFSDHTVLANQATKNFDVVEPATPITQIMADDDKFVIDELSKINQGAIDPTLKNKLDADKIGVMGHSVGGATAYNMAINDSRVKAAINLDGAVYITPDSNRKMAPFLMLANDKYHVQAIENRKNLMPAYDKAIYGSKAAYDKEYQTEQQDIIGLANTLKTSGGLYTITGSDHMKFTDIGLYIGSKPLRELAQIGGSTDPARCLTIASAVTTAFFDQQLKGSTVGAESLLKTYPELKHVSLN